MYGGGAGVAGRHLNLICEKTVCDRSVRGSTGCWPPGGGRKWQRPQRPLAKENFVIGRHLDTQFPLHILVKNCSNTNLKLLRKNMV